MPQQIGSPSIDDSRQRKEKVVEILTIAAVLAVAAAVYAFLFNRANVLSHSIGYNLYASERVLEGAVPYRDFHTLYPPAIFYLNAALFRWLGVSLYSALLGVLIFKVLTVAVIYLSGRQLMPRAWAIVAALSSLLWLRPNGPFKSVPMHYGALLLAMAMCLLLKYQPRQKLSMLFLAGISLGLLALFKHNIGAYALGGAFLFLLFENLVRERHTSVSSEDSDETSQRLLEKPKFVGRLNFRQPLVLLIGCAVVIALVLVYMQVNGASVPMIKTLLFGPGEFLLNRLAIPLSPVAPIILIAALSATLYAEHKLRDRASIASALLLIAILAISAVLLRVDHADTNQIIFYLPMLILAAGLGIAVFNKAISVEERRALLIVVVFSAAALMELFPRFAREQSIAAMPFVMLVLFYLLYVLRPEIRAFLGGSRQYLLALAALPLTLVLIEGRVFFNTYFDGNLRFKAATPVSTERAHSVYFPPATAALIDNAVSYIQERVPAGGNAFAQSDAGTSLLFLSNRRNVSNAQFWIGVGVTQEERAATVERIDKSQTKLIITSDEVLAAEKYAPMRDYIDRNFKPSARFDDVLILER